MNRAKSAKSQSTEAASQKPDKSKGITRLTLDAPVGLDIRIGAIAKTRGLKKGAFALQLLDQGCAKYDIDKVLRAAFPEIPGEPDPVA